MSNGKADTAVVFLHAFVLAGALVPTDLACHQRRFAIALFFYVSSSNPFDFVDRNDSLERLAHGSAIRHAFRVSHQTASQ